VVKVTIKFTGNNMTQIRADMERWARGFLGTPEPVPVQRSFADHNVQLDLGVGDPGPDGYND